MGLALHGLNPLASHSQFVDDAMLMGVPFVREVMSLKYILNDFHQASGTSMINSKSQLFFFNTPLIIQRHISSLLSFPRSSLPSKYMAIPLVDNALHNNS